MIVFFSSSEGEEQPRRRRHLRPLGDSALDRWADGVVSQGLEEHVEQIASKAHSIGGKVVAIFDDAVEESERKRVADRYVKLTGASAQDGWHREKASDSSVEHNAMAKDLAFDECDSSVLGFIRTVAPHFYERCDPERPMWVTRCSIYMQTFIDIDEAHTDRSHDDVGFSVTAIWYPHERWSSAWGGETVFLSKDNADLLLPVLPKPKRLLLFDSEITHMAKPATAISQPFAASTLSYLSLPTTRTLGNRFSFVLRTICGSLSVEDLLDKFDTNKDSLLSRHEAITLFRYLDIDRIDGALLRLATIKKYKNGAALYTPDDLKAFFDIRYTGLDKPRSHHTPRQHKNNGSLG